IFRQSKDLEAATEHFRMEKRLQSALRFFTFYDLRKPRDDAGQKMMLIGKTSDMQSILFRVFGDVGPINVRRDVGFGDLFERRIKLSMMRAHLHNFAKLAFSKCVIDHENDTALQTRSDVVDRVELRWICDLFR